MGWGIILLNRLHDIIPRNAIGPVYDQTDREYEVMLKSGAETALRLVEDLGDRIYDQGKDAGRGKPGDRRAIIISTQGYKQENIMTMSDMTQGEMTFTCDCLGHRFPIQYTGEDTLILYVKGIPSCGCAVYSPMEIGDSGRSGSAAEHSGYAAEHSGYTIEYPGPWFGSSENDWYRAEFDGKMEFALLVEKGAGGQLLKEERVENQLLIFGDRPVNWDNWSVDMYYRRKPYHAELVTVPVLKE